MAWSGVSDNVTASIQLTDKRGTTTSGKRATQSTQGDLNVVAGAGRRRDTLIQNECWPSRTTEAALMRLQRSRYSPLSYVSERTSARHAMCQ